MATRADRSAAGVHVRQVTTPQEMERCLAIRRRVFIEEQKVPEHLELDALDGECTHFLAMTADGEAIGTARLRVTEDGRAKAQRVAVSKEHRGRGVGALLMRALEDRARSMGLREVILGAQLSARSFYLGLGYVPFGEEFPEAGIRHVMMRKKL